MTSTDKLLPGFFPSPDRLFRVITGVSTGPRREVDMAAAWAALPAEEKRAALEYLHSKSPPVRAGGQGAQGLVTPQVITGVMTKGFRVGCVRSGKL